jgi:hypothetical protein
MRGVNPVDETQHSHSLGPLPKSNRTDELEQLGIDAFRAALPKEAFLFRDERIDDKGVDGSLEIKIDNRYTNLRSQVQLKSTECEAINQDGSVSWPVDTSNFNYLLNGPSPLYVLYVVPRNELRLVWAHDELRRLDAANRGWRNHETVTLRFAEVLSDNATAAVHDRIRREAQLSRRIREILGRATIAEHVAIAVDPTSFEVTGPNELYQFLSQAGMTAVCAGYAKQVLERARLLASHLRSEPRIRLLCAYAEQTLGKYVGALAHLVEILPAQDQLADYDRYFFQSLHNACLLQLGRITELEYEERLSALSTAESGVLSLQRQVNELKRQVLHETDRHERRRLLEPFRNLVDDIASRCDVNDPFKLHARIELLTVQGALLIDEFSFAATAKGMRGDLGMRYDTPESSARARAVLRSMEEWVEVGNKIIEDAAAMQHPILFGKALLASASVRITLLAQRRVVADLTDIPEPMLNNLIEHVEKAIDVFVHAGALERELRGRLLRADLHEFVGETDEARKIAAQVLPKAQAMDYGEIAEAAALHLSGESTWQRVESQMSEVLCQDPDGGIAQQSDEQVRDFATYIHAALDLPADRLPVVERYCKCLRDGARERLTWCRYLVVTGEDETFATDPERRCTCMKHDHQSVIVNHDWTTVIRAFKQAFCDVCSDREAKSE